MGNKYLQGDKGLEIACSVIKLKKKEKNWFLKSSSIWDDLGSNPTLATKVPSREQKTDSAMPCSKFRDIVRTVATGALAPTEI